MATIVTHFLLIASQKTNLVFYAVTKMGDTTATHDYLHIETEVHHIAILDHIFLAFQPHQPFFLGP